MNNTYELTVVYAPEATIADATRKSVEALLAKVKATIVNTEEWGEREFAYPVQKYDGGVYVSYVLSIDSADVTVLRDKIRHESGLLRWLLIKLDATSVAEK